MLTSLFYGETAATL